MRGSLLLLGLASFLLTSAAPPPLPQPVAVSDKTSPVRCSARSSYDEAANVVVTATRSTRQQAPLASPPPPPPTAMAMPSVVAPMPRFAPVPQENRERYDGREVASVQSVAANPVSTFSVDVDTGSYANVRRFLNQGQLPPSGAVRTEEMINYFRYDYPLPPDRAEPFSVTTDVAATPWNPGTRLLRIGLRGYDLAAKDRPAANLVFLVDVSGSMSDQNKLPLVKAALKMLADRLSARDHVSIVVYAGAAGIVLEPTSKPDYVKLALDCLEAGGSTAGGAGIELAYATARAHRIEGGVNRVVLATDGDFNVGVTDQKALEDLIKRNRNDGITLTTLGFGQGNYNEPVMERLADLGNGNYAYIDSAIEARKVLDEEMASTLFTIAKDVKLQIEFNPAAVSEYRLIGYENRALAEDDFNNDKVDAGDIGAGHQVTALYEIVPAGVKGWLPERRYDANRTAPSPASAGSELCFVKLRYKLPDGTTSRLIERPVPAALMNAAALPSGDMAFITAVASFGQRLRGDKYLNGYGWRDITALAGAPNDYYRQEFVKLVGLASAQSRGAGSD
jgi:Ca-activated chloride channel family protein